MKKDSIAERILKKVEEILFEGGNARFTMDDLVNELRMSKKTVYQHFRSKEELLNTVCDRFLSRLEGKIDSALASDSPPLERWVLMARAVQSEFAGYKGIMSLHREFPHLWERVEGFRGEKMKVIEELVIEAQAAGDARREVDPAIVHLMYSTLAINIFSPEFVMNRSMSLEELLKQIMDIFIHGIAHRKGE